MDVEHAAAVVRGHPGQGRQPEQAAGQARQPAAPEDLARTGEQQHQAAEAHGQGQLVVEVNAQAAQQAVQDPATGGTVALPPTTGIGSRPNQVWSSGMVLL